MAGRVEGKVAFITGAARGQGRSHAVRLAQEGADIIAVDVCEEIPYNAHTGATQADLAETVRQVEALDRRIIAKKADVRDFAALKAAVDEGVAELGRLDIVSANARRRRNSEPHGGHARGRVDHDDRHQSVGRLAQREGGDSAHQGGRERRLDRADQLAKAGIRGYANMAHYVSAKHGLVGMMRTLAMELAPDSIRVNSIHPTQVDTDMIQNQTIYSLFTGKADATKEEFAESSGRVIPLPIPWVESVDISNALLFLSSDEARYITGVPLPVDAGNQLT